MVQSAEEMYENLNDEQKEHLMSAKTPEELLQLAQDTGFELSDEQLEGIAGGWDVNRDCHKLDCPFDGTPCTTHDPGDS